MILSWTSQNISGGGGSGGTYTVNANPTVGVPTIEDDAVFGTDYHITGAFTVYVGDGTNDPGTTDAAFTDVDPNVAWSNFTAAFNANTGGNYSGNLIVMRDEANTFQKRHWWGTDLTDYGSSQQITITTTNTTRHNPFAESSRRLPSHSADLPTHLRENFANQSGVLVDPGFGARVAYVSTRFENVTTTATSVGAIYFLLCNTVAELSSGWMALGCEFDGQTTSRNDQYRRDNFLNTSDFIYYRNYSHGARDLGSADSQCDLTFQGARHLHKDCHKGGATEIMMFGGGSPVIEGLMITDVIIEDCHFYNPPEWHALGGTEKGYIKNILETKYILRLEVRRCLFENSWIGDNQPGVCFLIKAVNQEASAGGQWQRVEDVYIHDSYVKNAMLFLSLAESTQEPAGGVQRFVIDNILALGIGADNPYDGGSLGNNKPIHIIPGTSTGRGVLGPLPFRMSRVSIDWGDGTGNWGMLLENNAQHNWGDTEAMEWKGVITSPSVWGPFSTGQTDAAISGNFLGTSATDIDNVVIAGGNSTLNDDPSLGTHYFPATRADIGWDADMKVSTGKAWDTADYADVDALQALIGTLSNPTVRSAELNT